MSFNELEMRIRMVMDKLSNGEAVDIPDNLIEDAVDHFRQSLIKQLKTSKEDFRIRASNAGRPVCILQKDKAQASKTRNDYNHIMRMMIGDAVEAIGRIFILASGSNVTGEKSQAEYSVADTVILGENDIEVDNKIYDVKSCSPYAFSNKWSKGWQEVYEQDTFGYVEQLFIYTGGVKDKMGGWIVFDKSSGEVLVVNAEPTPSQLEYTEANIENAVRSVDREFYKQFIAEKEYFRKKFTGRYTIPITCTFCNYMSECWPTATLDKLTNSQAASPRMVWYVDANKD